MIKIRLEGEPEEINKAIENIEDSFKILNQSEPYANRGRSKYYRVYLDVEIVDKTVYFPISKLHQNENYIFNIENDDAMQRLVDDIKLNGVITPIVVRPIDDDKYEVVDGHRRIFAAILAGFENVPCIVKEMTDKEVAETVLKRLKEDESNNTMKTYSDYKKEYENILASVPKPERGYVIKEAVWIYVKWESDNETFPWADDYNKKREAVTDKKLKEVLAQGFSEFLAAQTSGVRS